MNLMNKEWLIKQKAMCALLGQSYLVAVYFSKKSYRRFIDVSAEDQDEFIELNLDAKCFNIVTSAGIKTHTLELFLVTRDTAFNHGN